MTHGEAYILLINQENFFKLPVAQIAKKLEYLPKRLPRVEAIKYYKSKIQDYFDSTLTVKDFDKIEDYFGFF